MTVHELKCLIDYFEAVWDGRKTFEVRIDDRGFQEGDRVRLREWELFTYTGREVLATIGYVMHALDDAIASGVVVFSLLDIQRKDADG